jgi:integrase
MTIGRLLKTKYPGVYRRESDGRLVIRVTARLPSGKWAQQTELQPEGTNLDGARRRAEVLRQRVQGEAAEARETGTEAPVKGKTTPPVPKATETVAEYAKAWLARKIPRLKPGPAALYHDTIHKRILPRIGHIKSTEVSRNVIEEWINWAERQKKADGKKYAQATLSSWWRVLILVVRDLAADHDIPDPIRRIRPPESSRANVQTRQVLTDTELQAFFAAIKQYGPQHYVSTLVMGTTGMRAGEVFALKWDAVDFAREVIHVKRTVSGGQLTETTKTKATRTVPMHSILTEALREHRQAMMADHHPGLKENWVFCTEKGTMRLPQASLKAFSLATEAAGIKQRVSPQVLRRTVNTLMLRAGVDRIVLRSVMGHVSEEMTARYAGVDHEDKRAAILKMFPEKKEGPGEG